jgi:hypothetical protein
VPRSPAAPDGAFRPRQKSRRRLMIVVFCMRERVVRQRRGRKWDDLKFESGSDASPLDRAAAP